jgi:DNA-binding CsgD family transcriptional regulator
MRQIRRQAWRKLAPHLKRPTLEQIGEAVHNLTLREQEMIRWCLDGRVRWRNQIKAKKLMAIKRQRDEAFIVGANQIDRLLARARKKLRAALPDRMLAAFFPEGIKFSAPQLRSQAKDELLTPHERIAEAIFVDGAETMREIAAATGLSLKRVDGFLKRSLHDLRGYLRIRHVNRRSPDTFSQQRRKIRDFVMRYRANGPVAMLDIVRHLYGNTHTRKQYQRAREDVCALQHSGAINPTDITMARRNYREKQTIISQQREIVKVVRRAQASRLTPTIPYITARIYGDGYTNEQRKTVLVDVKALVKAGELDPDIIASLHHAIPERRQRIKEFVRQKTAKGKLTVPAIAAHIYGSNYCRPQYLRTLKDVEILIAAGEIKAADIKKRGGGRAKRVSPISVSVKTVSVEPHQVPIGKGEARKPLWTFKKARTSSSLQAPSSKGLQGLLRLTGNSVSPLFHLGRRPSSASSPWPMAGTSARFAIAPGSSPDTAFGQSRDVGRVVPPARLRLLLLPGKSFLARRQFQILSRRCARLLLIPTIKAIPMLLLAEEARVLPGVYSLPPGKRCISVIAPRSY